MINSYYGCYRTKTFSDYFPDLETFKDEWDRSPFSTYEFEGETKSTLQDGNITLLYYSLLGKYGNRHFASSDRPTSIMRLFSLIWQWGPTWESRLDAQRRVQNMSIEELQLGSISINNDAMHDQTAPSGGTGMELPFISNQHTQRTKRGLVEALAVRDEPLRENVTNRFLSVFAELFIKVVAPDRPLLYANEIDDEEDDED